MSVTRSIVASKAITFPAFEELTRWYPFRGATDINQIMTKIMHVEYIKEK